LKMISEVPVLFSSVSLFNPAIHTNKGLILWFEVDHFSCCNDYDFPSSFSILACSKSARKKVG
jgi:hypothetical protein